MGRTVGASLSSVGVLALCACLGCAARPKHADYVGNPVDMQNCCKRSATVCPRDDDWIACRDDLDECHRLGLWYEDGIKVAPDPARARELFETLCDRFEMASCQSLCKKGDTRRCVDLALLGIAGAGGRPFPPSYRATDRALFAKACQGGDQVACLLLNLDYQPGRQTVVRKVNNCFDDHARCFAAACDASDPLGCALLCHVGDSYACSRLGQLALAGIGFRKPLVDVSPQLQGDSSGDYAFVATERSAGEIPRPPPPPQRPVGEGLWSGWKTVGNSEGGSFGITPVVTRIVRPQQSSTDVSGLIGFFSEVYMQSWYPGHDKYLRFSLGSALGGGSEGVDGEAHHEALGGFRLPLRLTTHNPYAGGKLFAQMSDKDRDALNQAIFTRSPHALFVRGGYSLRYLAVGPLLSSAIELPRAEVGYHFAGGDSLLRALELRANAGLVLVGRFNAADDRQRLGGAVALGGSLILHGRRAHVEVGGQRMQAAVFGDRPPVHRVDTNSCLRIVKRDERHYKYLLCLQERLEQGSSDTVVWQTGVFLGFDGLD